MDALPKTVSQLFPSQYLAAVDLGQKAFHLVIREVKLIQVHSPWSKEKEWRALVNFEGARKGLLLNATQARAIAEIAGSEEFEQWTGVQVVLSAGTARNGKMTIVVSQYQK